MLGWLFPRCHVDTYDKVWVEHRMLWLASRFGIDRLRNAEIILPTDDYFPASYEPNEAGARDCFHRICRYMKIEPDSVRLEIVDDELLTGAAGLYEMRQKSNIVIARSQLEKPPALIKTITHELAHELLLKGGHLTQDTADHEQITDLLPVFLGLGIVIANATVDISSWTEGPETFFEWTKQGYLSSIVLGHALAVFAYLRGDQRVPWAAHLRTDARVTLRTSLRYLLRTRDTIINPLQTSFEQKPLTQAQILDMLGSRSKTCRLAALWELAPRRTLDAVYLEPVSRCLHDSDEAIQAAALVMFVRFANPTEELTDAIINTAWNGSPSIRASAIATLGSIATHAGRIAPVLEKMVHERDRDIVFEVSAALAALKSPTSVEPLLDALERWAAQNDDSLAVDLVAAIIAIDRDGRGRIRNHFKSRDSDTRRSVEHAVRSAGSP